MTHSMTVFLAQYATVLLLGMQSLNVNGGHYVLAAVTSFGLGAGGYYLTAVIAQAGNEGVGSGVWIAFVAAGPCGIVTAMRIHPWLRARLGKPKGAVCERRCGWWNLRR
ncbi:MAG: hypothetical protein OEY97_07685 [Nitrospirota bacterium]|nr:hypothetical protein [Nitrospirota bacterium]